MSSPTPKPRILTGDTPTGRLHLGHYVGSVENRLAMQDQFDCYFIIANHQAFTTRASKADEIRQSVLEIATDYLACGIDPNKSKMFIQSDIPAFRPVFVPVGEDQLPHLELTREVARKFNQLYCNIDPQTEDKDYLSKG